MEHTVLNLLARSAIPNDPSLPVWIYNIEIPVIKDRRFFKIFLLNRYGNDAEINRITFKHGDKEYPVTKFSVVSEYGDCNIVGCIFEIDITDTDETVEITEEILNGDVYPASEERTVFTLDDPLSEEQHFYLKTKIPYTVYPQIHSQWWQCVCGRINKPGMTCFCGKCEADLDKILQFDFEESYIQDYLNLTIRYDPEKYFDDNIQYYLDQFTASHPEIDAQRVHERLDLQAEEERYNACVQEHEANLARIAEEKRLNEEKKKKRTKLIKRLSLAAVLIAALSFASVKWIIPEVKRMNAYNTAAKHLEEKEYDKAHDEFTALGNYKDSAAMSQESLYQKAASLFEAKEYDEAIAVWKLVSSYSDSEAKIEEATALYKESLYQSGLADKANKKYENAISTFTKSDLNGYKDAKEQMYECHYLYAEELLAAQSYDLAYEHYKMCGSSHSDAEEKKKECMYQNGMKMLQDERYAMAINKFNYCKGYKDADTQRMNAMWWTVADTTQDYVTDRDLTILKELITAGYSGAQAKYNELTAWHLTVDAVNNSKYSNSNYSTVSRYDTIYFHCTLSGGPPDSSGTTLKYTVYWPDGSVKYNQFDDLCTAGSGYKVYFWYENPSYGTTGQLKVVFYDGAGNQIGSGSVYITS
ncbi:MAG: hypothetical protein IKS37_08060 [Solobacterium sp.]|nr:hypothetical protein [Solobacterium sp.]